MGTIYKCQCCGEEFELPCSKKQWKWKISKELYCSFKCYSKVFDSKYQAAKIYKKAPLGYARDKTWR